MVFRKRPSLSFRDLAILLAIALAVVVVVGALLIADIRITGTVEGGGAFLSAWAGARGFVWGEHPPYSAEVAGNVQQLAYGRASIPGENPYRLTIPFFLLPLFFPFALTSSPAVARGVWLCLNQAALAGCTVVDLALVEWRPPRIFLLLGTGVVVFGLYSIVGMFAGTPAIILGLVYPAILWALQTERDELAGVLLAFSPYMWEVGALFLVLTAWWIIHQRRWRVFASLAMTLITLLAISFLLYPGWLLPFVTATVGQLRADYGTAAGAAMLRLFPEHGARIAQAVTILLSGLFIYEWWSGRHEGFRRFIWTSLLALAVTPLLGLRTELSNLVVLVPSVIFICAASVQRSRTGAWLALVMMVCVFVVPWALFGRWFYLRDRLAYDYLFLFYPLFSILGLYWTRRWFTRPTRTWLDEVRALRTSPGRETPPIDMPSRR